MYLINYQTRFIHLSKNWALNFLGANKNKLNKHFYTQTVENDIITVLSVYLYLLLDY